MSTSEYQKTSNGSETTFVVSPASAPLPVRAVVVGVPLILIGWSLSGYVALVLAGLIAISILVTWKGPQANKYRSSSTIKVSPTGIDANGKTVSASDLHRLILRNHVDGTEVFGGVQQYGGGVYAGMQNAGAALGHHLEKKRIQKLAEISYRLDVEHGGKATTLAGGLSETTAYGLMTDVSNILGLGVR